MPPLSEMRDIQSRSTNTLIKFTMHTALFRTKKTEFTDEEISKRAYLIWVKRDRPKGYESEIWREAVAELQAESKTKGEGRRFFQRARVSLRSSFA